MADYFAPQNFEELSNILRSCNEANRTLEGGGAFSKQSAGGAVFAAETRISTCNLNQVVAYEPSDLTISVEAGLPYRDLKEILAQNNQFLPLDPPFAENATVGGIIATNGNGPRRRRYGTARDVVIGMKFVTIEGKTIQSGGMVVKNVTGLDMGKLLIGSYGTLAVITVVNFKVFPIPVSHLSVVFSAPTLETLMSIRSVILRGAIQPRSIDLFNTEAASGWQLASTLNLDDYGLAVEVDGSPILMERCQREFEAMTDEHPEVKVYPVAEEESQVLWQKIQETTARLLSSNSDTYVIRLSTLPTRIGAIFEVAETGGRTRPVIIRAGNGVGYIYSFGVKDAEECLAKAQEKELLGVAEYIPVDSKSNFNSWPVVGSDLAIMKRIKNELDPQNLLNRGRLFNRL